MKKTSVNVNPAKKEVDIFVAGKMTIEDANAFVKDYQMKTRSINGAEYDLIVNCTDMEILDQDMTVNLTEVMKMYKENNFKKVIFQASHPVLKMQLGRVARNAGLSQAEVVAV